MDADGFPFKTLASESESVQLRWLRNHASYLGFSRLGTRIDAVIVFARGLLGNLIAVSALLLAFALYLSLVHPWIMATSFEYTGIIAVFAALMLLLYFVYYRLNEGDNDLANRWLLAFGRWFLPAALLLICLTECSVFALEWARESQLFRSLGFRECMSIILACVGAISAIPKKLPSRVKIPGWMLLAVLHFLTIAMLAFIVLRIQNYILYGPPPQYWRLDWLIGFLILTVILCCVANWKWFYRGLAKSSYFVLPLAMVFLSLAGTVVALSLSYWSDVESEKLILFTHPTSALVAGLDNCGLSSASNSREGLLSSASLISRPTINQIGLLCESKRRLDHEANAFEKPYEWSVLVPQILDNRKLAYEYRANPIYYSGALRFFEDASRLSKMPKVEQAIVKDHITLAACRRLIASDLTAVAKVRFDSYLRFASAYTYSLEFYVENDRETSLGELSERLRKAGLDEVGGRVHQLIHGGERPTNWQSNTAASGSGIRPFEKDASLDRAIAEIFPELRKIRNAVDLWLAGMALGQVSVSIPSETGELKKLDLNGVGIFDLVDSAIQLNGEDPVLNVEWLLSRYKFRQGNLDGLTFWKSLSLPVAASRDHQLNARRIDPHDAIFLLALVASSDSWKRTAYEREWITFSRQTVQHCFKPDVPLLSELKDRKVREPKAYQMEIYRRSFGQGLQQFEKDRIVSLVLADYRPNGARRLVRQIGFGHLSELDGIRPLVPNAILNTYWSKIAFVSIYGICLLAIGFWVVNPNATSLHSFYRERLSNTFLFAIDASGKSSEIVPDQQALLSSFANYASGSSAPYQLINTTVNFNAACFEGLRERNGDFFLFSPAFVGNQHTGYVPTRDFERMTPHFTAASAMAISAAAAAPNMGRYTSGFATLLLGLLNLRLGVWLPNPRFEVNCIRNRELVLEKERRLLQNRRMNLGDDALSAVESRTVTNQIIGLAFSGGGIRSASVNLGLAQALDAHGVFPLVDYLSTVSGGGYIGTCISNWMKSGHRIPGQISLDATAATASADRRDSMYPAPNIIQFFCELTGSLSHERRHLYVTDGGHVENLGAIPLLERRCKVIICGDAEADLNNSFDGFSRMLRIAELDHGIKIRFLHDDLNALHSSKGRDDKFAKQLRYYAIGRIVYPPLGGGDPEEGLLVYCKTGYVGDEDQVVQSYKQSHPTFPHESTGDQFFDEGQFEAYRRLGQYIGDAFCRALGSWQIADASLSSRMRFISAVEPLMPNTLRP